MNGIGTGRVGRGKSRGRLRAFQEALSRRIGAAGSVIQKDLRLGVRVGEDEWLVALADAGEVVPVPAITPVPLTKPWMLGVANIRGRLYSVTDLALFFGGAPTPATSSARLLLIGQRHNSNAAILVSRVLGLRALADLELLRQETAGWMQAEFRDEQGQHWRELAVARLLAAPEFVAGAA